jgi:hypothetical protein
MPDGEESPADERERQAWAEFWELVGEAAYQLWRERRAGDADQDSA